MFPRDRDARSLQPDQPGTGFWPGKAATLEGEAHRRLWRGRRRVTILELRRSTDPDVAALADYVYETSFSTIP